MGLCANKTPQIINDEDENPHFDQKFVSHYK